MQPALFMQESEAMLPQLYGTAYTILRSRADAEDAVQQALMKAWASRGRVKPESFRGWLWRIVINECHNIQRHRMRVLPTETVEPGQADDFKPPDPDLADAVQALPETIRMPFVLKYLAGLTEREIAKAMRLPVSTIKNRLAKARQLLRDALTDWEVTFK